jgi:serine phosphatase RsbU (regulator of sigma subunit)
MTRVDDSATPHDDAAAPLRVEQPAVAKRPARFHRGAVIVFCIGIAVTLVLSLGAAALNTRNERRLLQQRAREIKFVAQDASTTSQLPLEAGVFVALGTNGNVPTFQGLAGIVTGTKPTDPYISASLWRLTGGTPTRVTSVGAEQQLAHFSPAQLRAFFAKPKPLTLAITDLLNTTPRRLGYVITSPGNAYGIYTEALVPKGRKARIGGDQAFNDLDYAFYLGNKVDDAKMLASSTGRGVTGHHEVAHAKFGDTSILIAVWTDKQLGGSLLLRLPWILLAGGLLITCGSTLLAERLIRRRESAETLATELDKVASENERLYNEQRSVARTLQHTLLPTALPQVGFELAARYVAGDVDVEIGGDWYDVMPTGDGRVTFVIGDVSGRGIPAATVMASLRYSVRAYAAQGDAPDAILTKLADLLSIKDDGHFATVLCGRIDLRTGRIETANAGHLDPLLIVDGRASYLHSEVGVPIGAMTAPTYRLVTTELPAHGTLLLYTDGLIERRGESLDVGFTRLSNAAEQVASGSVEALLAGVVQALIPGGASDDTALLGLRWGQ